MEEAAATMIVYATEVTLYACCIMFYCCVIVQCSSDWVPSPLAMIISEFFCEAEVPKSHKNKLQDLANNNNLQD